MDRPLSVLQKVCKSKSKWIVDLTFKMWMSAFIYKIPVFLKLIHATCLVEMYKCIFIILRMLIAVPSGLCARIKSNRAVSLYRRPITVNQLIKSIPLKYATSTIKCVCITVLKIKYIYCTMYSRHLREYIAADSVLLVLVVALLSHRTQRPLPL